MPMGYPISPEQYRKMKEEAGRHHAPSGNEAQQDASIDEGDR